jgi:membrane-associated protease RseP (regulator of RpoE activity)
MEGANPFRDPASLAKGIPFSFTLMAILLTHEMGHFLTAKNYGVPATLPYFIPAPPIPFLIGTFGAFIRMKSPILTKKAILEIGASGPIAGFVVAILAVIIGLTQSEVVAETTSATFKLGAPLIFNFLDGLLLDVPEGSDVLLHPVAFAGWIGLFVTALNLIPIGQLDGGHVVYALLGKRHTLVSIGMIGALLVMGFIGWPGWYFWAFLTAILGVRHPPMVDPEVVLEPRQKLIGWLSLAIFALTFTPNPFMIE